MKKARTNTFVRACNDLSNKGGKAPQFSQRWGLALFKVSDTVADFFLGGINALPT